MTPYHVVLTDHDRAMIAARAAIRAHAGDDRRASAAGRALVDACRRYLLGAGPFKDIAVAVERVRVQAAADAALIELAGTMPAPVAEDSSA